MKRVGKGALLIVAAIVVLVVVAGVLVIQQIKSTVPSSVTDISQYEEILGAFPYMRLADHFPKTIPANARNVRMDYYPGSMMGGGCFKLNLTLPADQLKEICDKYSQIAPHCLTTAAVPPSGKGLEEPPDFYTSHTKDYELSESSIVLVLVAESMGEEDFPWNHGQTCGLSVDRNTRQVIYWAEWW